MTGQLCEGELQACYRWRAERDQEKQWAQAEAQRGLVAMGSPVAVGDLVAEAQRVANSITAEALYERIKSAQDNRDKAEELMKLLETEKQRSEVAKGKKRTAEVAVERGGKSGKP